MLAVDQVRRTQRVYDFLRAQGAGIRIAAIDEESQEFIPALTAHSVGIAYAAKQTIGGDLQQLIASLMTKPVIDLFEVIEINIQKRKGVPGPFRHADRPIQSVCEQGAVGQSR